MNEKTNNNGDTEGHYFSLKWYTISLLGCIGFVALLLWGIYVPAIRHISTKHIVIGDSYLEQAARLNQNPDIVEQLSDERRSLDDSIQDLMKIAKAYEEWTVWGNANVGDLFSMKDLALRNKIEESLKTLPRVLDRLDSTISSFKNQQAGKIDHPVERQIQSNIDVVRNFMPAVLGTKFERSTAEPFGKVCNNYLPSLVNSAIDYRDLFHPEGCYEQAIAEYLYASGVSRFWTKPRLKLANTYREAGWDEFAMAEYLKILRIDKSSPEADQAMKHLASYAEGEVEGRFNYALGLFMYEEYEKGLVQLKLFLRDHPTNILAPKAYELTGRLESGDKTFVKRLLRDEIFI